jgi:hypothetical protein
MKLPVNAFLYVVSTGLLGGAGFTFYRTFPDQTTEARMARHNKGLAEARDLLAPAKDKGSQGRTDRTWNYAGKWWKDGFMGANVLGKEKPKTVGNPDDPPPPPPPKTVQPLADIIELVAVMYGSSAPGDANPGKYDPASGKGDRQHVIVRYKGQVTPPEWYLRENQPVASSSAAPAGPTDSVAASQPGAAGRSGRGGARGGAGPRPATPMPGANASTAGAEILQHVWVAGDGTPHFENTLWAPYSDIKLVRVDLDSRYAVFVRVPPPPKEGEKPEEPKEEQLFQTSVPMSQEMAKAMSEILRQPDPTQKKTDKPDAVANEWIETDDTKKINGRWQVGRKDQEMFSGDSKFFEQSVNAESYVSHSVRGLMIRNVNPQVASRFGISPGDVLIEVNGERVETRADAMAVAKRQYDRGTRTFVATFLSNGQQIDRTYQMPPGSNR